MTLKAGLIINPWAGIGGAVALRGSDGPETRSEALRRGAEPRATARCADFLDALGERARDLDWFAVPGAMGGVALEKAGLDSQAVGREVTPESGADTRAAVQALESAGVDFIVFVGGDGTARDVLGAGPQTPVLGIPAGVKMHSGVFAVSPRTAALIVLRLLEGELVACVEREVRDFVDPAPNGDEMQVQGFGHLAVPEVGGYLQQTKVGGRESEPLALEEISAGALAIIDDARDLIIGPGSTCAAIKAALGLPVTLRGFDARRGHTLLEDASANDLHTLKQPFVIVSFTRGQGFLFGRGNQQLDTEVLGQLDWPRDVLVVGTRTKLATLDGQPLLVDTGDAALDARLSGLVQILTGYEDMLFYRVATEGS